MKRNYKLWSDLPYAGEKMPPKNPEERYAGDWPLCFLRRDEKGIITDSDGCPIQLIRNPNKINWKKELEYVKSAINKKNKEEITIAEYWGTGVATKQWTPIIDRLIDTYSEDEQPMSAVRAGRILAAVHSAINDAFVVTWVLKYKLNVARPNQLDSSLATIVCTPRHPTYPSGHAAVSGCAAEVLSYFFPGEAKRLRELAEECAEARLFGGVHFPIDNSEGLRLGREVARAAVNVLESQKRSNEKPVDFSYHRSLQAELPPPAYKQVIDYTFKTQCTSKIKRRKSK
jgi:hypothetical protein